MALVFLSSIDDIFIDIMSLSIRTITLYKKPPEAMDMPNIGIFVANWMEENVLRQMVEGNLKRIPFQSVKMYVGVYPNDEGTKRIAYELERDYPDRVHVVVNTLDGPTSKGQLLNEMFRIVYSKDDAPEMVVMHDSEDVIDYRTFEIYAALYQDYDFIQTPVFSLDSRHRSHTAATYMDEFAEKHTRELVVRNALGAMVPSAGVGTCLNKKLILHFIKTRGTVLDTGSVTEDYILGAEAFRAGFKSYYASVTDPTHMQPIIATYEYFPKDIWASIVQKTRWTYGINFEGTHIIGWNGNFWNWYFYARDRKGMIGNFLPFVSAVLMVVYAMGDLHPFQVGPTTFYTLWILLNMNFLFMILRYVVKVQSFKEIYGFYDPIGVAIRWPVAIFINMMSAYRAWWIYLFQSRFATRPITWSKTVHEVPEDFEGVV
jgi:adsorption protein B